jgi:hypothetical protein
MQEKKGIIITGAIVGLLAVILVKFGNPANMGMTVLGMTTGAAFAHNFNLASSAKGPTPNGQAAVIIGFAVLLLVSYFNLERTVEVKMKGDVELEA